MKESRALVLRQGRAGAFCLSESTLKEAFDDDVNTFGVCRRYGQNDRAGKYTLKVL